MILGVSCYADLALVVRAMDAGAAYVAMGAMFPSKTKTGAAVAPLERIGQARGLGAHVVASGGIGPENIALVAAAGADATGVVSAIFDAADPTAATAELVARFAMGVQAR
jgi:thiamine-phosphate pyrophosphorylase